MRKKMKRLLLAVFFLLLSVSAIFAEAKTESEPLNPRFKKEAGDFKLINPALAEACAAPQDVNGVKVYHAEKVTDGVFYVIADFPGSKGHFYGYASVGESISPLWGYVDCGNGTQKELALYTEAGWKTNGVKAPVGKFNFGGTNITFNGTAATVTSTLPEKVYKVPQEYGGYHQSEMLHDGNTQVNLLGGYSVTYSGKMTASYKMIKDAKGNLMLKMTGKPAITTSVKPINDGSQLPAFMARDVRSNHNVADLKNRVSRDLYNEAAAMCDYRINPALVGKNAIVAYTDSACSSVMAYGKEGTIFGLNLSKLQEQAVANRQAVLDSRYNSIVAVIGNGFNQYSWVEVTEVNPVKFTAHVNAIANNMVYRGEVRPKAGDSSVLAAALKGETVLPEMEVVDFTEDKGYVERAARIEENDRRIRACENDGLKKDLAKPYAKQYKKIDKPAGFNNYFGYVMASRQQNAILQLQDKYVAMLFDANELPQTNEAYSKALEQKAKKGDIDAMIAVGDAFINGNGVAKDPKKAESWYAKAADKGSELGYRRAAGCHSSWNAIANSPSKAFEWIKKGYEKGIKALGTDMGQYYESGLTTGKPNLKKAMEYYTEAANNGVATAYLPLGKMYRDINLVQAVSYMQKAMDSGVLSAADKDDASATLTTDLVNLGRTGDAERYYKSTTSKQAHLDMGIAWLVKNKSLAGFETILTDDDPEWRFLKGYEKYMNDDKDMAQVDFNAAAKEGLPEALSALGMVGENFILNPDNDIAVLDYWMLKKPRKSVSDLKGKSQKIGENGTTAQRHYANELKPYIKAMRLLAVRGSKKAIAALLSLESEVRRLFDIKNNPEANEFVMKDILNMIKGDEVRALQKQYFPQ